MLVLCLRGRRIEDCCDDCAVFGRCRWNRVVWDVVFRGREEKKGRER